MFVWELTEKIVLVRGKTPSLINIEGQIFKRNLKRKTVCKNKQNIFVCGDIHSPPHEIILRGKSILPKGLRK